MVRRKDPSKDKANLWRLPVNEPADKERSRRATMHAQVIAEPEAHIGPPPSPDYPRYRVEPGRLVKVSEVDPDGRSTSAAKRMWPTSLGSKGTPCGTCRSASTPSTAEPANRAASNGILAVRAGPSAAPSRASPRRLPGLVVQGSVKPRARAGLLAGIPAEDSSARNDHHLYRSHYEEVLTRQLYKL